MIAEALYAFGAMLCVLGTCWSIAFIVLVQLNYTQVSADDLKCTVRLHSRVAVIASRAEPSIGGVLCTIRRRGGRHHASH